MGRHSKKFHNLRAMNESRRLKAAQNGASGNGNANISSNDSVTDEKEDERRTPQGLISKKVKKTEQIGNRESRGQDKPSKPVFNDNSWNENNGDDNERKRPRRDIRRTDNQGIPLALANLLESSRKMKRFPMRYVPAIQGFSTLSKMDSKRDIHSITTQSIFEPCIDEDSDEEYEAPLEVTAYPACSQSSNLHAKRKRLTSWASNPKEMQITLQEYKNGVARARKQFKVLAEKEEHWNQMFEASRIKIDSCINQVAEEVSAMKKDSMALVNTVLSMESSAQSVPSNGISEGLTEKSIEKIVHQLKESQTILESKIDLYEKTAKEFVNGKNSKKINLVTSMSVDECDYAWDSFDGYSKQTLIQENNCAEGSVSECLLRSLRDIMRTENVSHTTYDREDSLPQINSSEQNWAEFLSSLSAAETVLKSSSDAETAMSISAPPITLTPRDTKLIISTLSQYEDKYLGTLHENSQSKGQYYVSAELFARENAVIDRCQLQSQAANADSKVRKLRGSLNDWRKISSECNETIGKVKGKLNLVINEAQLENTRIQQEIEAFCKSPGTQKYSSNFHPVANSKLDAKTSKGSSSAPLKTSNAKSSNKSNKSSKNASQ